MILTKTVDVCVVGTNVHHYQSIGLNVKCGQSITVSLDQLSPNSNKKIKCQCDRCGSEYEQTFQNVMTYHKDKQICYPCDRYLIGVKNAPNLIKFVRYGSDHPWFNPNKNDTPWIAYKRLVTTLTAQNYRKHKDKINPHNFPRRRMGVEGGYQLDHRLSIREGFEQGIPVEQISSPENLQMLPWKDNILKSCDYRNHKINRFLNTTRTSKD